MRKITLLAVAVAAACAVLALGVLASCAKQAPKAVTVYMWSEYIDPALLEQFEKETGQKVVLDTYENTETMMSKIASASDLYDVVVVSDHAVRTLSGKGTFRQLDLKKIPNAKNVMARFRNPAYDPEQMWSLPYQWGTMGRSTGPTSCRIFHRPGQRCWTPPVSRGPSCFWTPCAT